MNIYIFIYSFCVCYGAYNTHTIINTILDSDGDNPPKAALTYFFSIPFFFKIFIYLILLIFIFVVSPLIVALDIYSLIKKYSNGKN